MRTRFSPFPEPERRPPARHRTARDAEVSRAGGRRSNLAGTSSASMGFLLAALAAAAGLAGCQSAAPGGSKSGGVVPTLDAGVASAVGLSDLQVSEANVLYIIKCARCHKFYDPAGYEENEWSSWMKKMGKKSKLTPDQYELLSRYLAAFRQQNTGRKTPQPP